jgi:hypothetical protein
MSRWPTRGGVLWREGWWPRRGGLLPRATEADGWRRATSAVLRRGIGRGRLLLHGEEVVRAMRSSERERSYGKERVGGDCLVEDLELRSSTMEAAAARRTIPPSLRGRRRRDARAPRAPTDDSSLTPRAVAAGGGFSLLRWAVAVAALLSAPMARARWRYGGGGGSIWLWGEERKRKANLIPPFNTGSWLEPVLKGGFRFARAFITLPPLTPVPRGCARETK